MTFNEAVVNRDTVGRFSEKNGLAPEIFLDTDEHPDELDDLAPALSYTIPMHNLEAFRDRIDKANRKLERAGIDERFKMTYAPEIRREEDGSFTQVASVELNQPVISHGDFRFLAYHEATPNGDFITHAQGRDIADPTDGRCDHCKLNRHRGKLYTVQNKETGEVLQVGSTCLEPFFGVKPSGLWALENEDGLDLEEFRYQPGGGNGSSRAYDGDTLLLAAYRATNRGENYVSRDRADYQNRATADIVREQLDTRYTASDGETYAGHPTDEETAYIKRLKEYVSGLGDEEEYERNLKTVLTPAEDGSTYVGSKHIGIAASAVAALARADRQAARDAARAAQNASKKQEYLAPPKTKVAGVKAKVTGIHGFDNQYGYQEIVIMQDDQGHILKWKTSSSPDLSTGDDIVLSATVKDNEVYNGDFQTSIIRPKFEKQT
jgi:hypothetical protein